MFFALLLNYFIFTIWLRVARSIFGKSNQSHYLQISLIGICSAGCIRSAPHIIEYAGISFSLTDSTLIPVTLTSLALIIVTLLIIYITISQISHRLSSRTPTKKENNIRSHLLLLVISGARIGIVSGLRRLYPGSNYPYIGILAGLALFEELLKIGGGLTQPGTHEITSNIIIRSIVSGLGFAFGENIIYLIESTSSHLTSLSLSRGATSFLMHAIFTGSIGYVISKFRRESRFFGFLVGIGYGLILHIGYNLIIQLNFMPLYILIIGGAYIGLSRLFYQSDSVYIENT